MARGRNVFKLITFGTLWAIVFFVAAMILVAVATSLLNPNDAAAAGQRAGQLLALPVMALSIASAIALTAKGWLPGTRKPEA